MTADAANRSRPVAGGFAARLREATQTIHREAERSGYIADLLRGRATRRGYAVYLANLLPAYEAMETRLRALQAMPPALRAFADPALFRAGALRADIAAILEDGAAPPIVLPEAIAYAAAIDESAPGLIAHAYARYLGDLSGGQILHALLARTLGLVPPQLTMYAFPGIADLDACKAGLRQALDTVPEDSDMADRVIAEALAAFRHTIAVSTAVSVAMAPEDHTV